MSKVTDKIREILEKKREIEVRKGHPEPGSSGSLNPVAKGVAILATGAALMQPARAEEKPVQDNKIDNTEQLKSQEQFSAPIYFNVTTLKPNQDFSKVISSHPKAAYDSNLDCVVCYTYQLSDADAYAKVKGNNLRDYTLNDALNVLRSTLDKYNYQGAKPQTLDDVKKLEDELVHSELNSKKQEKIRDVIRSYRLDAAIKEKQDIEKTNISHTSAEVITHEFTHKNNVAILQKALLPSSVVSPQQLFLLYAADEIEARLSGKTGAEAANLAVKEIRSSAQNYTDNWYKSVEANKTILQTSYTQNLDIEAEQVVDKLGSKNYEKLLKEMIPDDNLRATVKMALEQIKKDKLVENHNLHECTGYQFLEFHHNEWVNSFNNEKGKELINSTKAYAPLSDDEVKGMIQSRRKSNKSTAEKRYAQLVNASDLYTKSDNGKIDCTGNTDDINSIISGKKRSDDKEFSAQQFLAMAAEKGISK